MEDPTNDRADAEPSPGGQVRATRWGRGAAHLACGWMLVFAAVHVYWGVGGGLLLPAGFRVTDVPALWVVDLVAVPLCLGGALVGRWLLDPAGTRPPLRWRLAAGWAVSVLALVHSVPTVVEGLGRLVGLVEGTLDEAAVFTDLVYEPWWFVGGVLFAVATEGFRRRSAVLGTPLPVGARGARS